jgi:hypothetical protein
MHEMNDDELAALRWLHGRDRGRVETVYFRKDTKNEAPFAQPGDVKGKQAIGMSPGHAALIRLLRGAEPLNADIRSALASALEPVGVSEMKAVLELKRRNGRGRPPKGVEGAVEAHKTANRIKEGKAAGGNQKSLVADTGASPATVYRRLKMVRGARKPEK